MIDIKKVLTDKGYKLKYAAKVIFPNTVYSDQKMSRAAQGDHELTESEIRRLSEFTGTPVSDLFSKFQK